MQITRDNLEKYLNSSGRQNYPKRAYITKRSLSLKHCAKLSIQNAARIFKEFKVIIETLGEINKYAEAKLFNYCERNLVSFNYKLLSSLQSSITG